MHESKFLWINDDAKYVSFHSFIHKSDGNSNSFKFKRKLKEKNLSLGDNLVYLKLTLRFMGHHSFRYM